MTPRTVGGHFSEGSRLLWVSMEQTGLTQARLAERLEVDTGRLSRWLWGTRRPGLASALRIQDLLNIPATSWGQAPRAGITLPRGVQVASSPASVAA